MTALALKTKALELVPEIELRLARARKRLKRGQLLACKLELEGIAQTLGAQLAPDVDGSATTEIDWLWMRRAGTKLHAFRRAGGFLSKASECALVSRTGTWTETKASNADDLCEHCRERVG